jgi:hypothetical protein
MDMFSQTQLKGQRASKKALKDGEVGSTRLAFPYAKLKFLRGDVTQPEILDVFQRVVNKEITLQEAESELVRLKEMRAVQKHFMKQTNCTTWTNAKERYSKVNMITCYTFFKA